MSPARWDALTWIVVSAVLWLAGGFLGIVDEIAPYVAMSVAFAIFFTGVDHIVKAIEKSKK